MVEPLNFSQTLLLKPLRMSVQVMTGHIALTQPPGVEHVATQVPVVQTPHKPHAVAQQRPSSEQMPDEHSVPIVQV